jgi:hypothetical protein
LAAIAALAAVIGYSQTLGHKTWPPAQLALWFPWAFFAFRLTGDTTAMVFAALAQYPFLAVVFGLGIHRWSTRNCLIAVCGLHAMTIVIAFALLG